MASDNKGSFTTHAGYLRAFARMAGYEYISNRAAVLSQLNSAVQTSSTFTKCQRVPTADLAQVKKSLSNAWGTELLLALTGEYASDAELVGLANNWGVVQAYYCMYHATQAIVAARAGKRPDNHPKTQNIFMNQWVESNFGIGPWAFAADKGGYRNVPNGMTIDESFHQWKDCDAETCWHIAGKALRTTRSLDLPDAVKRARENKRKETKKAWIAEEQKRLASGKKPRKEPAFPLPQLSAIERKAAHDSVRAHTVMDYLYRLRVKSNYQDAGMFVEGPTTEYESRQVHRDLRDIVASTMLVHELHVRQLIGKVPMGKLIAGWLPSGVPPGLTPPLASRRDLVLS